MPDILHKLTQLEPYRMVIWLLAGLLLYAGSIGIGVEYPQAQVILQKAANVTFFSWLGYLVARNALGRLDHEASFAEPAYIARAILMGCAILSGSMGL